MKLLLYLILLGGMALKTTAQSSEGYIVDQKGDTLFGEVNWIGDPFFIERININGQEKMMKDLTAFFNGKNKLYQFRQDSIWCKVRVLGPMSLLQHVGHYFVEKDSQWVWLENDQQVLTSYAYSKVKTTHRYRKILNYLMSDCGDFQNELASVKYVDKPLIKVVEAYNLCRRAPYIVY